MKFSSLLVAAGMLAATVSSHAMTPEPDVLVSSTGQHLVVNLPQTRVFLYQDGTLVNSYPVAVGKMITNTPTGNYAITGIYRNPVWHVPKSIQEEMARAGKPVQTTVAAGPDNPLGPVFIRFGEAKLGLGFHGTNQPASVPGFRSHGCVRLRSENALELADWVDIGAAVTISYQTTLLSEDSAGELWLHAYPDSYRKDDLVPQLLAETLLNWQHENQRPIHGKRVDQAFRERNGKPVCLSCKSTQNNRITGTLNVVRWLSPPQEIIEEQLPDELQPLDENSARAPRGAQSKQKSA
ncbi:L,D-transpeptidase [Vogesella sp. LYT5W]|uniref:L,D-transpeptidase n=1 Tax=Vogesella margarita TaxID=2984199 RepID=A0ABT5IMX3_9NEIS|nr:L,D-transpeptidase [Vogesella margarita]MDC7713556.1 L,D-transpeptidase [Vogesella margarita]